MITLRRWNIFEFIVHFGCSKCSNGFIYFHIISWFVDISEIFKRDHIIFTMLTHDQSVSWTHVFVKKRPCGFVLVVKIALFVAFWLRDRNATSVFVYSFLSFSSAFTLAFKWATLGLLLWIPAAIFLRILKALWKGLLFLASKETRLVYTILIINIRPVCKIGIFEILSEGSVLYRFQIQFFNLFFDPIAWFLDRLMLAWKLWKLTKFTHFIVINIIFRGVFFHTVLQIEIVSDTKKGWFLRRFFLARLIKVLFWLNLIKILKRSGAKVYTISFDQVRFDLFLWVLCSHCIEIFETWGLHDEWWLPLSGALFDSGRAHRIIAPLLDLFELLS